jgi:hypothetical protein
MVGNNPIDTIDVLGLWPWTPDPTGSKQATKAGKKHRRKTNKNNLEYCGLVCKNDKTGKITTTSTSGTVNSCRPYDAPCQKCSTAIRAWHTHPKEDAPGGPYDSENFSDADKNFAEKTGLPLHLNTPGGKNMVVNPAGTIGTL